MYECYDCSPRETTIPIVSVVKADFTAWLAAQDDRVRNWVHSTGFKAKSAEFGLLCDADGQLELVFVGMEDADDFWAFGRLAQQLSPGTYHLENSFSPDQEYFASLAWGLGSYQFTAYKHIEPFEAKLKMNEPSDRLDNIVRSIFLVRDLINTPTEDMGPAELAEAAKNLAEEFSAGFHQFIGDELLDNDYPTIHAVGRASHHAPRLIELSWGKKSHPKITLVAKGVCFDSGGLDLKPPQAMQFMKKDMSGAAHALGLARMIMSAKLPIRLRVLIPAVENVVSGDAYKPGDVITTRKGLTVEVNNTDAEGRLVIADALAEACTEDPELLIDLTTLTGAATVALGSEVGVFFTEDDELANDLLYLSQKEQDPLWRLPLYQPYKKLLESKVADLSNASSSRYGGAITAALFLQHFVQSHITWVHFDLNAWNDGSKPGRPEGGEAQGLRVLFHYLQKRFG